MRRNGQTERLTLSPEPSCETSFYDKKVVVAPRLVDRPMQSVAIVLVVVLVLVIEMAATASRTTTSTSTSTNQKTSYTSIPQLFCEPLKFHLSIRLDPPRPAAVLKPDT
jgi:hypothetical protein